MLYAEVERPSVPPERLLREILLQIFYSVQSERMLMQKLDYNLLFRSETMPCFRKTAGAC